MNHVDKSRPFNALRGSTDIEEIGEVEPGTMSENSLLMDFYAGVAQRYLDTYGADASDFARVAVKNRSHAALNPLAHLRKPQTVEDVMNGRMIVAPLTLAMCSPTTDGAAAIIVCSEKVAATLERPIIMVRACQIASGANGHPVADAALKAYNIASASPDDFDLIELHDAAAPAELMQYHEIQLCAEGDGFKLVREGITNLGGKTPVNTSGGLLSRGHPLGATGCAQIAELVTQLRGEAGARQVDGAKMAMSVNGGGWLDGAYALAIATILERVR
jgi:acetyl-CoA acetyltransferase